MQHTRSAGRITTGAKPKAKRELSSREYVAKLAKQWRDQEAERERLVSREMPMPDGIMPAPPPIDPRSGIPLPAFAWAVPASLARMSGGDVAKTYRANDAARSNFLLRRINQLNEYADEPNLAAGDTNVDTGGEFAARPSPLRHGRTRERRDELYGQRTQD